LFHLFGRISHVPSFALTEEDILEFVHRMQSDAHRPEQLFDELRSRHLLLIGVRFTNWLMRMFLRSMHGSRLSEDSGQLIILAGDVVRRDAGMIGFLREASQHIWIYEDGNGVDFVRELHKRWSVEHDESWATTTEGEAPIEPEPMPAGAVYVSCSRADRPAAERFAAVLDEAGLDAWFDRNEVQGGARYENRVRQNIQRCDLFVPLISRQTETQSDGFFRREWEVGDRTNGESRRGLTIRRSGTAGRRTCSRATPADVSENDTRCSPRGTTFARFAARLRQRGAPASLSSQHLTPCPRNPC
jgi:hypothetical protein